MNEQLPTFRLSPQQESLLAVGAERPAAWQCTVLLPPVRETELRTALDAIVARHEILRTTFVRAAGARVPVAQAIHESLPPAWTARPQDDLDELRRNELDMLDIESGPVVRALFAADGNAQNLLVLTALAACADMQSLLLVAAELSESRGPTDPLQYADYADWRTEMLASSDADVDLPPAEPLLFGSPANHVTRVRERVAVLLERGTIERASSEGTTADVFLEAAWHTLIARLTGMDHVVVAGVLDGRSQPELEGAVGPYSQPLPIRSRIEPETSFAEVVDQIRRERNAATRRQDSVHARELTVVRERAVAGFSAVDIPPGVALTAFASTAAAPAIELVFVRDGRLALQYDPEAYGRHDVDQVAAQLATLLRAAAEDPGERVSRLRLVDEDARARLVALSAGPLADIPPTTVHGLFERQAERTASLPAVATGDDTLNYSELNANANRLAHHLRALGVTRNEPVGLCLDRSPAMLTALLAILKAGGAYLPLNFEHPKARLAHQLEESAARFVVTHANLVERLPSNADLVLLDDAADQIAAHDARNPDPVNEPEDLAYVMYTSGSTGLPKGVAVTHRNVVNYVSALVGQLDVQDGWNFALVSAISTDLGNTAIFPALASGGCLHLISPQASMDGDALTAYAAEHPIDVLKITPSHLRALMRAGTGFLPRRWLVLGGEASSWNLVEEIRAAGLEGRILNHYGPTETTIGCCTFALDVEPVGGQPATVPIGRPIANARAYVLAASGEPAPMGVAGELCIGGAGVARGYVNRPDETSARFVPDPFGEGRIYRTGDRARFLPDGNIEFLGRVDEQLKIRGFRVEPGEIEAALVRHPAIAEATVAAREDGDGDPRLVAYIVADRQPDPAELRMFLSDSLPEFMVPSLYEPIDALPLTPSGKIDRRALPEPGQSGVRRGVEYVAPRDDLEAEIAALWEQLLGVPEVGVNDDFFALGGHSLLATQAIIRIRRKHGEIPLGAMFNASTVAALADVIRAS